MPLNREDTVKCTLTITLKLVWTLRASPYVHTCALQDTVVALQALAHAASIMYTTDVNLTVVIDDAINENKTLVINADNMDVLQLVEVILKK